MAKREPPQQPIPHGTQEGYHQHCCRCDVCREAQRLRRNIRRLLRPRLKTPPAGKVRPANAPHGTPSSYNYWGCRCPQCREAVRLWRLRQRMVNPELRITAAARKREWLRNNPDKAAACRETMRKRARVRGRNLTHAEIEAMLVAQGGVCAICRQAETQKRNGRVKDLAIDHSHATGHNRGLLCARCNRGVGCFKDDTALLAAAITYLQAYP